MFDVEAIASAGLFIVGLIVFAESGLLLGFFLPGDTLLITVGILAAGGKVNLWLAIFVIAIAAIVGDNVGYYIGKLSGKRLFHKKDGILFKKDHVQRAEAFYEKHGGKTVIFARYIPIIRTFAPLVAGIGHMDRVKFVTYDIFGAFLWSTTVTLFGYFLGKRFPGIVEYIDFILIAVVLAALLPAFYHVARDPYSRKLIAERARHLYTKITKR